MCASHAMRRPAAKDVFDRWTPVWHVLFYVMIATATVLARTRGVGAPRVVGLVGMLTAWHWFMIVRPGPGHRERPRQVPLSADARA